MPFAYQLPRSTLGDGGVWCSESGISPKSPRNRGFFVGVSGTILVGGIRAYDQHRGDKYMNRAKQIARRRAQGIPDPSFSPLEALTPEQRAAEARKDSQGLRPTPLPTDIIVHGRGGDRASLVGTHITVGGADSYAGVMSWLGPLLDERHPRGVDRGHQSVTPYIDDERNL